MDFLTLTNEIKTLTPGLFAECSVEWGSHMPDSRVAIRQSIAHRLRVKDAADKSQLDNLSEPPRLRDWSISISHTHNLGGWMAVKRPVQIGWDVELKSRIKNSIIERVCSARELEEALKPELLWGAKEAYFKALEDEQPLAITQLSITGWRSIGANLTAWTGLGPRNGEGYIIDFGEWLMAACVIL